MSVRKIPPNRISLTGLVASRRQGRMIGSESSLERDLYIILDFDLNVDQYIEQPVKIEYYDAFGNRRTYTPDVLIHYRKDIVPAKTMKSLLCEVKYRQQLFQNWKDIKPKILAGRSYAKERGWEFKILTEQEIRTPYLENAKFLRSYRNLQTDWDLANVIQNTLTELREADPETLLTAITSDRWKQAEFIPMLWHLIARQRIGTDLSLRLNMKSRIFSKS
jgi:hypothetical protein